MTIFEMLEQGAFISLLGMICLFIIMIIQLSALGRGVEAKPAQEKEVPPPVARETSLHQKESNDVIVAVISAAVNEYRKNNK